MRVIEYVDELEAIMSKGELLDVYKAPPHKGEECVDLHTCIEGVGKRVYRVLANI